MHSNGTETALASREDDAPITPPPTRLRWRDKLEIVAACVVVPVALELLPATRALRWIARIPTRASRGASPARAAWHVDRLLARAPGIWKRTCLRRAAVLAALLRREGLCADVQIGVRRAPGGTLEAHAWLRCGAVEPYLEAGDVAAFVPLRQLAQRVRRRSR